MANLVHSDDTSGHRQIELADVTDNNNNLTVLQLRNKINLLQLHDK